MKAQCPKPLMSLVIYESPVTLAINVLGHICYILVSLGYSQPWLQSTLVTVSLGYCQPWLQSALVAVSVAPVSLGYSQSFSSQRGSSQCCCSQSWLQSALVTVSHGYSQSSSSQSWLQ